MIRIAKKEDKKQINVIRKEIFNLHSVNENSVFKNDFSENLIDYVDNFFDNETKLILVYEEDNQIQGVVLIEYLEKSETAYSYASKYAHIVEIGVLDGYRGKGVGLKLMDKAKIFSKQKGYDEIRLDVWSFNQEAVNFYKKSGMEEYRTMLRMKI